MYFSWGRVYIYPVIEAKIKVMTAAQQNHNYIANLARITGYWKGITNVYATELTREGSLFTKQEIGEKFLKAIELTDKWFEHRYEGPFSIDDIEAMIKSEATVQNDIVELERA